MVRGIPVILTSSPKAQSLSEVVGSCGSEKKPQIMAPKYLFQNSQTHKRNKGSKGQRNSTV